MNFKLAAFRQRLIFRGVFLLLIIATVLIALVLLTEEKKRSYTNYQQTVQKTYAEIMARLRHPTGRLMLLNPQHNRQNKSPLSPLMLPYAAIDFTDKNKALQAVEMTGCAAQYANGASLCVAMGYNPWAGSFIYLVGSFTANQLVGRPMKQRELDDIHRLIIHINLPYEQNRWVIPFEDHSTDRQTTWGRLPGFKTELDHLTATSKEDKEFRGWLWQNKNCIDPNQTSADCPKQTFFAIRVPVTSLRTDSHHSKQQQWPPLPLNQIKVQLQALAPHSNTPLFDSNDQTAALPPTLEDISQILMPGEQLTIHKTTSSIDTAITLESTTNLTKVSEWYKTLIELLPIKKNLSTITLSDSIAMPLETYQITLNGNIHIVDHILAITTYRMLWYVGGMIIAIILSWIAIELGLIRPIVRLTKQAAKVTKNMQSSNLATNLAQLDFSKFKSKDELGILATALSNLLQRVKDDLQRETIRAQQERDMWHAVGHEIMSPLQSLMVLHHDKEEPSYRYLQRIQQAIKIIYGTASPSEAFTEATLQLNALNLNEFLTIIADNALFVGIKDVHFIPHKETITVRADEFSLEDVVTHILHNADRYRYPNTTIQIHIETTSSTTQVHIYNQGDTIDQSIINNIFEYGVSDLSEQRKNSHRGQGLFVAKTYMAKMGGTIHVKNENNGVTFILTLQRQ